MFLGRNLCYGLSFSADGTTLTSQSCAGELLQGKCFDSYLKLLYPDEEYSSRLSKFDAGIGEVPAGCNGMVLAPWVQGIKSPVSNSYIGATMVGFRLGMSEPYLARAIAEGLCLQFRWVIESQEKAIKRNDGTKLQVLQSFLLLLSSNGSSISKYMRGREQSVSTDLALKYIKYLCDAYIVHKVERFDIRGKKLLENNDKYYFEDAGIIHLSLREFLVRGF